MSELAWLHMTKLSCTAFLVFYTPLASAIAAPDIPRGHTTHHRAIVGGSHADPERYPYYVRLDYEGEFGCGGSLIHRDFVLTAAHCAFPSDLGILEAVVGGHNYENGTGYAQMVRRIVPHPAYDNSYTNINDIALLQIDPLPMDADVTVLKYSSDRDLLEPDDSVTVIGMGLTQHQEDAEKLKEVEVKIVDDEECDGNYDGDIHRKSMICAVDINEDSCHGDSGGPLLVLGDNASQDIQVGVVSWGGDRCANVNEPGVYTDVAYLQPWIDSVICEHSTQPPEGCKISVDGNVGPIYINPETDVCRDFGGAFHVDWWHQFQRCDWLRQDGRVDMYCEESHEAWVQCPLTCHSCTYEAEDDWAVDDTWTNYDQSSSPTALVFLFIFSALLCCQIVGFAGCCLRRKLRERKACYGLKSPAPPEHKVSPNDRTFDLCHE